MKATAFAISFIIIFCFSRVLCSPVFYFRKVSNETNEPVTNADVLILIITFNHHHHP